MQLRALQARYGIRMSIPEILRLGWRGTLRRVISHFNPADYPQLFAEERDSLITALRILKKLPLVEPYNEDTVTEIFQEESVPAEYYQPVLREVFPPTEADE